MSLQAMQGFHAHVGQPAYGRTTLPQPPSFMPGTTLLGDGSRIPMPPQTAKDSAMSMPLPLPFPQGVASTSTVLQPQHATRLYPGDAVWPPQPYRSKKDKRKHDGNNCLEPDYRTFYLGTGPFKVGPHEPITVSSRPLRRLGVEYGNWGGPGFAGGDRAPFAAPLPPVDSLDQNYKDHDINYHLLHMSQAKADRVLIQQHLGLPLRTSDWEVPPSSPFFAQLHRAGAVVGFTLLQPDRLVRELLDRPGKRS